MSQLLEYLISFVHLVKMVHQGAVDVLLESLQVYARSSHVNDTQLKLFLTLLLQLHSKGETILYKVMT